MPNACFRRGGRWKRMRVGDGREGVGDKGCEMGEKGREVEEERWEMGERSPVLPLICKAIPEHCHNNNNLKTAIEKLAL